MSIRSLFGKDVSCLPSSPEREREREREQGNSTKVQNVCYFIEMKQSSEITDTMQTSSATCNVKHIIYTVHAQIHVQQCKKKKLLQREALVKAN